MKIKKILLGLMLLSILFLTGCGIYGEGKSTGFIYAIDDGIVWDKVWFKSDLTSSESDCYLIDNDVLKEELININSTKRITIHYKRHLFTVAMCPEGTGTGDEIYKIEVS